MPCTKAMNWEGKTYSSMVIRGFIKCEKYSADSMYSYVYVYRYIYVNIYNALIVLGILLVCDVPMY